MDRGHVVNWELQKTLWLRGLRSRYERASSSSPSAPPPCSFQEPEEARGGRRGAPSSRCHCCALTRSPRPRGRSPSRSSGTPKWRSSLGRARRRELVP